MSYSTDGLKDAGKITILTTLLGVAAFAVVFFFSLGGDTERQVEAQSDTATTSVTVLNTPPVWDVLAHEDVESSTSTPTNAGGLVTWVATATDSNAQDYYLLVCSNSATPTANSGAAPDCDAPANQIAVSSAASSSDGVSVSTTTTASMPEKNDWWAWVCDSDPTTPRCNNQFSTGSTTGGGQESPFVVNHRPTFTLFNDESPADPGVSVTFYSTSSDPDSLGGADTVQLWVCNLADFGTATSGECGAGGTIASSTFAVSDPSASYTIVIPTQDQNYNAFGYIIDEHGFEASGGAQGTDSTLTVNNVAPTVTSASITLNGGSTIVVSDAAAETTGFTIEYVATDNNSCQNASGGDEIVSQAVSVFRSGIGSTTCSVNNSDDYDPNNCYTSAAGTSTVWTLSCTASSTDACGGSTDPNQTFDCTFPLWYISDPTVASSAFPGEDWNVAVEPIDDDNATTTGRDAVAGVELDMFLAFTLNTPTIPYGTVAPGDNTSVLLATTTIAATGNVGLDEALQGTSMCATYQTGVPCNNSATSTIPATEQEYASSTLAYGSGTDLSSTTANEFELNVSKSTATSTQETADTFWGIAVPGSITRSGAYTGENTIFALIGEAVDW